MTSRWITNLESLEPLEAAVAHAQDAVRANPDDREMKAMLELAQFKLKDVRNTYARIESEYPYITLGSPMATEWRSATDIAAQGIIGVYRAGRGSEMPSGETAEITV